MVFKGDDVGKVSKLLARSEYKRFQSAPGPKVTSKAFGRDRRFPLTSGLKTGIKFVYSYLWKVY